MTVNEILDELKALGSTSYKKTICKNHGVKEPCFGVKVSDMKKIQKRIKVDYQLALDLYETGNYDAMYLAGLIADDERMTKKDLRRWVKQAYGGCLFSYTVPWVTAGSKHGWALAMEWIESPKSKLAAAGWATLRSLVSIIDDEELDVPALKKLLRRVKQEIHKTPDLVRYQMNEFIISTGCYVQALTKLAIECGEKNGPLTADLGNNSCKVPFAPDYIHKVQQRGTIGKKRKTAKC